MQEKQVSRIPLEDIRDRVRHELDSSFLAPFVTDVNVESADDIDDATVRVLVEIKNPRKVDIRATNEFVRRLRLDFMADDDRFIVFQFPEAA